MLKLDIKLIQQSSKTLAPAGKTSNVYRLTKEKHSKMRRSTITLTYKITQKYVSSTQQRINLEK